MHDILQHTLDYTNTVFLFYFLAANIVYTVLMVLSLYTVSLNAKWSKHKPYQDLIDSPCLEFDYSPRPACQG